MKTYSKPLMVKETFMPSHYCQVCYPINQSGGIWAPRKETNGIPGCQVTGVSPNYKDYGNTESIPADLEGRNPDGLKFLVCSEPVYVTKSTNNKPDPDDMHGWEAYYQNNTGGFVWNFHCTDGSVYYMLYSNNFDGVATNHS